MNEIVKGGLYRHFKGMYYYVLDVATHSETGEIGGISKII